MDIVNILKVEEAFGKARKCPEQSINSWVAHMKSLASQLKEMSEEVAQHSIAQRILNRVGKEYRSTKASLRSVRRLMVDMVSQQLEAVELEMIEEAEEERAKALPMRNSL